MIKNSNIIGKYIIVKDLAFSDYMKDAYQQICIYETFEEARDICGMYEFENALILKIEHNHIEQ